MIKQDDITMEPGPKPNPAPTNTPPTPKTDTRQEPQSQTAKPNSQNSSRGIQEADTSKRKRNIGRIILIVLLVLFGIAMYFKMKESV